jgi:imidazole glycerol-phosphate synthase subunit HisH
MIVIVDYQMGNLRSVQKGFERVGHQAMISSDPLEIAKADKLVLPGVGAFGDAISELRQRNLIDPIREVIGSGRPFLGICLGLQLLFDVSYEGGEHEGFGILPGKWSGSNCPKRTKSPTWDGIRRSSGTVPRF